MSDYLCRLEVPADKKGFTVAEALGAMSKAFHPDLRGDEPKTIRSIFKVAAGPGFQPARRSLVVLNESDWQQLRLIWSRLDPPVFPMEEPAWQVYLEAFNSSRNRPKEWDLQPDPGDPGLRLDLKRAVSSDAHLAAIKAAVDDGSISLRNPLTGVACHFFWPGDADDWLLTRSELKKVCEELAIELVDAPGPVPHFVTSARPLEVPAALLGLPDDARISYERNIGRERGSGITNAADYRDATRDTIARQAGGHFTLNEAAQVLADRHPGLDPAEAVKRFRMAHSKGELPIHQGGSRFPLEGGETIRDFWDTLEVAELDSWLRASVGYGFPKAESAPGPTPATSVPAIQEQAADRGRRVKRAALIADNVSRWPTIERDLKDAATNGLSEAAKDGAAVGWWWEGRAIEWARARAKVQGISPVLAGVTSMIHRMRG